MLELKVTINTPDLATAINSLAGALSINTAGTPLQPQPQPVQQQPPAQQPQQAPVGVPAAGPPTYTVEQLQAAAGAVISAGRRDEALALLTTFGAASVDALPPEQRGAFATELRKLGAAI